MQGRTARGAGFRQVKWDQWRGQSEKNYQKEIKDLVRKQCPQKKKKSQDE